MKHKLALVAALTLTLNQAQAIVIETVDWTQQLITVSFTQAAQEGFDEMWPELDAQWVAETTGNTTGIYVNGAWDSLVRVAVSFDNRDGTILSTFSSNFAPKDPYEIDGYGFPIEYYEIQNLQVSVDYDQISKRGTVQWSIAKAVPDIGSTLVMLTLVMLGIGLRKLY